MLKKWISTNLGIKILALFIAIILWFHAVTEKMYEEIIDVPVSFTNLEEGLIIVNSPPKSVKVKLRGNGKDLIHFKFGEGPKVLLDLKEVKIGWKRLNLKREDISIPYWSKINVIDDPEPKSFVIRVDKLNK